MTTSYSAATRAEMRELGTFGGQGLIVELLGRLGVERQVEMVAPAELEARPRQRVVALARRRVALGEIRRVGGDLVGDDADLDVVAAGEPEMLLGRHVAEQCRAEPADHRRPDAARDVVVAGCYVG